jgi:hypothetical protein
MYFFFVFFLFAPWYGTAQTLSLIINGVSIVVSAVQVVSALCCEPFGAQFESITGPKPRLLPGVCLPPPSPLPTHVHHMSSNVPHSPHPTHAHTHAHTQDRTPRATITPLTGPAHSPPPSMPTLPFHHPYHLCLHTNLFHPSLGSLSFYLYPPLHHPYHHLCLRTNLFYPSLGSLSAYPLPPPHHPHPQKPRCPLAPPGRGWQGQAERDRGQARARGTPQAP